MRILFIAPLPNPVTGHALASEIFLEKLIENHDVDIVNQSKKNFRHGITSFSRILEVLKMIFQVWRKKGRSDIIYLTISESFAGNIKDIFFYFLCFKKLSQTVIHVHGGSLRKLLFDKHPLLFRLNKFFIRRLGGVIVLGQSHIRIFEDFLPKEKIHIVPNCPKDHIFTTKEIVHSKFKDTQPLRILFLSNLIEGKGYCAILDAYLELDESLQKKIAIDFAGNFQSESHRKWFLDRISHIPQIQYLGIVRYDKKREIFSRSHIFCLPTTLYEGQPVSILEAYASGCAVITTNRGGIPDIFQDKVNGFEVEAGSISSLKQAFYLCTQDPNKLRSMAITNFETAQQKYTKSQFTSRLIDIVHSICI